MGNGRTGWLGSLTAHIRGWFVQPPPDPAPDVHPEPDSPPRPIRPYRARKRSLPQNFSAGDRRRAMEYWGHCCAICGRPAGLWHTVALDHWIPLSHPECPGTIRTNMIPMCHGNDGCNNHKHAKHPRQWLIQIMGKRKALRKLDEIDYFFRWMENPSVERSACPYCDKPVYFCQTDETWTCNYCQSTGAFVMIDQ